MVEERLIELLERVLGKSKKTNGNNYAFYSPFAEHYKPKLEINIKTTAAGDNPWHCWISDEKGKTIRSLFKKLNVSSQIWDEYNSIFRNIRKYTQPTEQLTQQQTFVQLPKEFTPLWESSKSVIYSHALNYILGRGIRPGDIVKYGIGYCVEGEYSNKIIIPSYDSDGMLNYFVSRAFYDTPQKHKNPKVSKDIIGFDLYVNWNEPIVICEGVFDAIAIRRNAIPIFGKTIPPKLEKKILDKKVSHIYVCLDSDAINNSIQLCEKLMGWGIKVHLVQLDSEDASELGYDKINTKIYNTPELNLLSLVEYKMFRRK